MPGRLPGMSAGPGIRSTFDPSTRSTMTDTISLTGLVATTPKHVVTATGLSVTSFRFASTQRRYDRAEQKWVDGDTNWYTVATFRQLATNVVASVQKGQRVLVTGRLRVRDWATEDKRGTNVEIDAEAVGHDLSWGTTTFTRSTATAVAEADAAAEAGEPAQSGEVADEIGEAPAEDAADSNAGDDSPSTPARLAEPVAAPVPF
jgi:single-strand DNA-binding protein